MNIIIVGGGKVGYFLLKSLEASHQVTLIDKQRNLCEKLAEEVESPIYCGDGSSLDVLSDAGIHDADVIVAATGKDEENLVICQIAKLNYNIPKTIARINNPKNVAVFKTLGVDKTVCSTQVIANMLETTFQNN